MVHKKLGLSGAALGMLILILDSKAAAHAAAEGVEVCIHTVIPSLFPFFLLSGYLTAGITGGKRVAKLFHSSQSCGGVILSGLLGGYPMGAKLASQEFHAGRISQEQADRLLWFCSQAGPSFLFGIVAAQLPDSRYAWMLWAVLIISTMTVAWLIPRQAAHGQASVKPAHMTLTDAMQSAIRAMASVCGWVVVFRVLISFLQRWVLWLFPDGVQIILCGILELTSGCLMLPGVQDPQLRFLAAVVMVNFGGLCVLMQTISLCEGLHIRGYLLGKLLQTALSVLYALVFLGKFQGLLPILLAISLRFLPQIRNRGSIPVKLGV